MSVHYVPAKRPPTPDILGNVLGGKVGPEQVEIESIQTNGGTQPRAGINEQHVQDLVEAINRGDTLPAVDVYFDGSQYWLYDGFHRVEAHNRCRKSTILANIHQGTQADAQWASYGANPGHGLKRTNEDKRRAVLAALRHPNAASLSNVQIAAHVHVDEGTIRNYRAQMEASSEIPKMGERTVTRGGQTYTQNVSNIGANQPVYAEVWRLQHVVQEVFERFYDADDLRHACSDMRMAARTRTGGFWVNCERSMPDDIKDYRKSDLSQAINNLAAQKETKLADNARLPDVDSPAQRPDRWAVALQITGSRQLRSEALARAIMPWVQEYRDTYGRNWQDLARNGNPAHSNSTFWQDIGKELKRRLVTVDDDTLKLAIKQAFAWLLAEEPAKTQPAADPGYVPFTLDYKLPQEFAAAGWRIKLVDTDKQVIGAHVDNVVTGEHLGYHANVALLERDISMAMAAAAKRRSANSIAAEIDKPLMEWTDEDQAKWISATQGPAPTADGKPMVDWTDDDWATWIDAKEGPSPFAAPTPVSIPVQPGVNPLLLKGSLRRWLGARYENFTTEDAVYSIYQMLDNWLKGAWRADLEDFTATLPAGWTQDALDQAIRELHVHFAPDEDEAPAVPSENTAPPVIGLNELAVVDSVTAPAGWTDPEPESDLDCYDDEVATVAARRMNKLHTLKVRFAETIALFDDFGELTGRHTATLLAGRELTALIGILDGEMDALQAGVKRAAA